MATGDDTELKKQQGGRLRQARLAKGLATATDAAAFLGVNRDTYTQHENGTRSFRVTAARYAGRLGVTPEWLLWGRNEPATLEPIQRKVPVMGEVAAGLWREAMSLEMTQATEHVSVDVPGFESARLYALKVVGKSMDDHYKPGRYVIVAPAAEVGVRWGDHVIVQRHKADLVELTIKALERIDGRTALVPHSSDPSFKPVFVDGPDADQAAPKIIGVVVADWGTRRRPPEVFDPKPPEGVVWAE